MSTAPDSSVQDFPLSEVPLAYRRPVSSLIFVLLGMTFFTATMFAGGKIGIALPFWPDVALVILIGNLLLGAYVALLAYISCQSGLNTVLMGRIAFGNIGSRWSDLLLGLTQVGWYGWGTATMALVFLRLLGVDESDPGFVLTSRLLMIIFGAAFCCTAYIGYRGLELLSRWAVPLMAMMLLISLYISLRDAGGISGLLSTQPERNMSLATAVTLVFGTFASAGTQATNWTRFAPTSRAAVGATLIAFFIGNALMVLMGAIGALVYHDADIVNVLVMQGMLVFGLLMLFLNIWTTQDNAIYNFSAAGCNLLRSRRRRLITACGAAIGTLLALLRIDLYLVPFLVILGTLIPPLGGILIADFFYKHRGQYPQIADTFFVAINPAGIGAYILASLVAFISPGMPPINGIVTAIIAYPLLDKALNMLGYSPGQICRITRDS